MMIGLTNKVETSETYKSVCFNFQWHCVSCVVKLVAGVNKEQKFVSVYIFARV